jgi:predicted phage terminase large subunit-like protein
MARAEIAAVTIRQGLVRLPAGAEWEEEFVRELVSFPNGPYADQVDALTQLVTYLAHWLGPRADDHTTEIAYAVPRGGSR